MRESDTKLQYANEALWEAEAEIKKLREQVATLTADHARPDTIKLEKALGRACVLITNHVNAYGTGMDLPMDLLANSRKPEAWKKYFMQEADQ